MMDRDDNLEMAAEDPADVLLQQLFHLKGYESPDSARMIKNKQNIMRSVREASSRKRWSLSDLLEVNIPWFFSEPRYGIAALFIVFAGLQFLGANAHKQTRGKTGIYTSDGGIAMLDQSTALSTNRVSYPKLPDNLVLFPDQQGDTGVKFVGRVEPKK
ncbi:MAG: hypothetical protein DRP64_11355 [Verrucomicrobia bacterium]|nr:MAG: hypothetical protein DRP64_11355 [Verrucomicrobiota bacterium]